MFRTAILLTLTHLFVFIQAQTFIGGGVVTGIWEADGNPYIVEGDLYVGPDDRLTVKEGVEVFFGGNYAINVVGRLEVVGTLQSPVLFSMEDTTGFSTGSAGWKGIRFTGPGPTGGEYSGLQHCIVEYSASDGVSVFDYTQLTISDLTVRNNLGYGLKLGQFSNIQVTGLEATGNHSGGINIDMARPQITNFLVENNQGSGILVNGGWFGTQTLVLSQGEIRNNSHTGNGGGLSVLYHNSVELKDLIIQQNQANLGGGIYCEQSKLTLEQVEIRLNQAVQGAGLHSAYGNALQLSYCIIAANQALESGGGMYLSDSEWSVDRCTFADNSAGWTGGAIAEVAGSVPGEITSTILWNNLPEAIDAQGTVPVVTYSDVMGGYPGQDNIDADPLFENAEAGLYRLTWTDFPQVNSTRSPCIDAGYPYGNSDPDGTLPDMGALHFNQEIIITSLEKTAQYDFNLYPNPAGNSVSITTEGRIQEIQLMNLSGGVVRESQAGSSLVRIGLDGVPSGIYLVKILWNDGTVVTKKLVKE